MASQNLDRQNIHYQRNRRRKERRGVVLLIVLSLIVLFMLLVVTFIVSAGTYRVGANSTLHDKRTQDDPRKLADTALYQLLRDVSPNFFSSLRDQSLLNDLYGNDGIRGIVRPFVLDAASNPIATYVDANTDGGLLVVAVRPTSALTCLSRAEDYYNGRVLAFVSGALSGYTTRVLDYQLNPGLDGLYGRPNFDDDGDGTTDNKAEVFGFNGTTIDPANFGASDDVGLLILDVVDSQRNSTTAANLPAINDQVVINGAPFNGTGFGYDKATGLLNADAWLPGPDQAWGNVNTDDDGDTIVDNRSEAGWAGSDDITLGATGAGFAALFSHRSAAALNTAPLSNFVIKAGPIGVPNDDGGADEPYDCVDYQNLYLAQIPPDANFPGLLIPSFHRPELLRYLFSQLYNNSNTFANLNAAPGAGATRLANAWAAFVQPYGADYIRGTGDDPPFLTTAAAWDQRDNLVALKRACLFRPIPEDHRNFNGSNPFFHYFGSTAWIDNLDDAVPPAQEIAAIGSGIYDVDNDGDTVPDSIWMDIGLPIQTTPDGRRFRPLVAILCKDLDGRANVSAHGCLESMTASLTSNFRYHPGPDRAWGIAGVDDNGNGLVDDIGDAGGVNSDDRLIAGTSTSYALPRGLGIGPAEINLSPFFPANLNQLQTLTAERYRDAKTGTLLPGVNDAADDVRSYYKNFLLPQNYGAAQGRGFATPPDTRGLGAVMLDHSGQPLTRFRGMSNETWDDPYESLLDVMTAGGTGSRIQRYFVSDLELLLRRYDADSTRLPRRLQSLSNRVDVIRNYLTVHSSHIPTPNTTAPQFLRDELTLYKTASNQYADVKNSSPTLIDLYRARLLAGGVTGLPALEAQLAIIAPFEFRRGQLLDLNRPFGNGLDDNGNFAIDDFAETQTIWNALANSDPFFGVTYEGSNNDPLGMNSRIVLARHLYCLMMLLSNEAHLWSDTDGAPVTAAERATRIAQWAVNVVDFRDADAIMTPFEFDTLPFDGWEVDGDPGTVEAIGAERGIVWGCEYPDLIMTENVAFHDRHVKDTALDDGQNNPIPEDPNGVSLTRSINAMMQYDSDLDQYRIPEGSLFIELQCMRNNFANNPVLPGELYSFDTDPMTGNVTNARLDLGRLSPERAGIRYPVWRIAVGPGSATLPPLPRLHPSQAYTEDGTNPGTPNIKEVSAFTIASTSIERVIWMSPSAADFTGSLNMAYGFYGRTGSMLANNGANLPRESTVALYPGQYAVVGPRAVTYVGDAVPAAMPGNFAYSPQVIDLSAGFTATNTKDSNIPPNDVSYPVANTLTATSIICAANPPAAWTQPVNQSRLIGINVSEPLPQSGSYYREPLVNSTVPDSYYNANNPIVTDPADPAYNALPDQPFDEISAGGGLGTANLGTGTNLDFKSLYLQRLADPTRPWNPDPSDDPANYDSTLAVNPYIVVDWSRVDLTVFTGDEDTTQMVDNDTTPGNEAPIDPDDIGPYTTPPAEQFGTRSRNGGNVVPSPVLTHNVWSPRTANPPATPGLVSTTPIRSDFPVATDPSPYFKLKLRHTLGYLNHTYGPPATMTPYTGVPNFPIPWIAWLDRPFASPYEMLLVPSSSPDRLLFDTVSPGTEVNLNDSVAPTLFDEHPIWPNMTSSAAYDPTGINNIRAPFAELLNFFSSNATGAQDGAVDTATHFYRIFDYVEVPSPFVGTEKWLDPRGFKTKTNMMGTVTNPLANEYRPPFNRISQFRDPGRININTAPMAYSFGPDGMPGVAGTDDDGNGFTDFYDLNGDGIPDVPDYRELFAVGSDDQYYGQIWECIAKNFPSMDPTVPWLPGADGAWGVAGVDDDGDGTTDESDEAGRGDDIRGSQAFVDLIISLQGKGILGRSRDCPTLIGNPFRTAASADLMPNILIPQPGPDWTFGTMDDTSLNLRRSGIDAGLLRRKDVLTGPSQPLFATNNTSYFAWEKGPDGAWGTTGTDDNGDGIIDNLADAGYGDDIRTPFPGNTYLAADRNPYFYYQGLTRLENLVTTHSNVFAIWITVGFFEVEENRAPVTNTVVFDAAHPDGLRLGQEIGLDTGETKRHRSFFIIDRSIPAAFERGQNHNIDRTILLRRVLE